MICNKVTGNYVNNFDFEISEYELDPQSCIDFPTICGRNFCEWYRAFGKPVAGGNEFGSSCCRNIMLKDEPGDFICGIYQNNVILPDGDYQGRIEIMCDPETVVTIDKIVIGLISGLDQNNIATENITENQIPINHVLKTFTNIQRPDGSFIIIPYEFTLSNGQGSTFNQLYIYTLTTSSVLSAHFWLDNVVIKKKLYAYAGEDKTVCKDLPVTLGGLLPSTTAIGGMPNYQYLWTCNNSSWTSTSANPTLIPSVTTTYYLTVKDEGGNGNIATDQVTITVDNNCPCLYPVIISESESINEGNYYGSNSIANKPNEDGSIVLAGSLESNLLSISNGFSFSHSKTGPKKFISKFNNKGYTEWALVFEGDKFLYSGHSIFSDELDNTYMLLNRWGEHENRFESENNVAIVESGIPLKYSFFLLKVNSLGVIVWSRVINDIGSNNSIAEDFAISNDGLYVLGKTDNGFKLGEQAQPYPGGDFLLKLNKDSGLPIWFMQAPSNFSERSLISIKDNFPFIESSHYINQVFKINPANGAIILPVLSKPTNTGTISTSYGGNNMFYDFTYSGLYPSGYSIRSFKLETLNNKEVFNFKKSVEGPLRFPMGYSPNDDIIYYQKVTLGINGYFKPHKFVKQNMLYTSVPAWEKDISNFYNFMPSCRNTLTYGYFLANDLNRQNNLSLNQFNLQSGISGCWATKNSETIQNDSIPNLKIIQSYFDIYPNPTKNVMVIKQKEKLIGSKVDLQCFNSMGSNVLNKTLLFENYDEISIDISHLPIGTYLIKINYNKDSSATFKILKE